MTPGREIPGEAQKSLFDFHSKFRIILSPYWHHLSTIVSLLKLLTGMLSKEGEWI
jgi:hypothetical protein